MASTTAGEMRASGTHSRYRSSGARVRRRARGQVAGQVAAIFVIAGLLHDTLEDTETTREELAHAFGDDIAALVAEVSDDKTLKPEVRQALQIEGAPNRSVRRTVERFPVSLSKTTACGCPCAFSYPAEIAARIGRTRPSQASDVDVLLP